ncbi:MAG: beta-propeller fold lactonase family protein [Granulicella sp.]
MLAGKRLASAMTAGLLMFLCGCSGFFPPINNGGGGGGGTTTGNFVYVANVATQTIAGFSVATSTAGAASLTAVTGSPYASPVIPTALAITPKNTYLYVAGIGGIYVYSINSTTGALTLANSGGAAAVMVYPAASIDISPDGQWLIALSQDNSSIQEYQINSTTGTLAAQQSANYNLASLTVLPKMVRFTPNAAYVIAALGTAGDVVFPFTTATGVFSTSYQSLAPATNSSDNALAIDSTSGFLYIARSGANSGLAVLTIGTNGTLRSVTGSPFAAGNGPFSVVLDSTGRYAYVGNRTDSNITGYAIGAGGALTVLASSPYATGTAVNSLARDSSGKYILATAGGGSPDLTMYSFDATTPGALDSAVTMATGTASSQQALMVVATH